MADKVIFFYDNTIIEASLSASNETKPVDNLKRYELNFPWIANTTTAWFAADNGAPKAASIIALWGHNFTSTATIRVRIGDDPAFAINTYDEEFSAYELLYGYDEGGYDEGGYDGTEVVSGLEGFTKYTIIRMDQEYSGRYWRIDVTDTGNPDGNLRVGWWGMGIPLQPQYDLSLPMDLPYWVDPSEQFISEASSLFVSSRNKFRVCTLRLDFLSKSEALNEFNNLTRICGGSRPLVAILFPSDDQFGDQYRTAIYGLITSASQGMPIQLIRQDMTKNSYSVQFTLRELI